ncbi:MAG TPA: DUF1127 domain-containing protein [Candidatus Competibacter sp.]|nr:DUF1127 domain-containing protein [Candidatus Competibacteraceae bacterium]HPE71445.1 DUF1127 domain-containing protein [Candidatus Competibacter sp.]
MTKATTGCCEPPVHRPATFTAPLTRAFRWLREAYRVSCQRRALLALDAAMLKDLGLSRVDALQEGHKPFWRL